MLKRTLKIIIGTFLGLVALISFAAIYYQFDEDLSPDVLAVLNYTAEVVEEKDNGYYHMLGLYAEKDSIPMAHGLVIIQLAKEKYKNDNEVAILSVSELENGNEIEILVEDKYLCYTIDGICLDVVKNNKEAIENILKDNALIIQRFKQAYDFNHFQETPVLFGFEGMLKAHRLVLTSIAFKWINGDKKNALELLNQDLAFWRMVTRGEVSLITRIIAVAIVGRNMKLWSEIVTDCNGCSLIEEEMIAINNPLTVSELSLRKVFGIEYRYMHSLLEKAMKEQREESMIDRIYYSLFFKKNSTLNKIYRVHKDAIELSECDISRYLDCENAHEDKLRNVPDYTSWEFVKDPVGSILAAITLHSHAGYMKVYFVHEANRRLILVKHMIYKNKINSSGIQAYLDGLPANLHNPFDGTTIKWNADNKSLVMTAGNDNQVDISVSL